ncbi:MAG: ATP-dependent helicase [Ilumatobacter sp.]|uniref:ATP-dependent helicase n=1 Tax=Ilumatobacter sp. TaxID=1967498 RepID=UPI00391911FF
MAIACAYCGGEHDQPAEVRRCWVDHGEVALDPTGSVPLPSEYTSDDPDPFGPGEFDPGASRRSAPRRSTGSSSPDPDTSRRTQPGGASRHGRPGGTSRAPEAEPDVERGVALAVAGPDALGRHAVVAPDQEAPAPWTRCERVRVDASVTGEALNLLLAALRLAGVERRRLVIELAIDLDRAPRLMTTASPFQVGASFAFGGDELYHLVWSNSIDVRSERPQWLALDRAIAAGLQAVEGDANRAGDVVLPDGTPVWIDGGPVRFMATIDDVAVLHATAIEHGSFVPPVTNEVRADLAPDQLDAVTHGGGAARIIAPAGSGKTRVLTERARHLLINWRMPPSAVSLVAFNKRAQVEMQERTPDLAGLHVRTLNAIGLAIVNGSPPFAPQPTSWRTINEPDVRRIIGDLVSFPRRRNSDPIAPWIEALSLVRLGLVDPADAEARYGGDVDGFADFWPRYRDALERRGAVDFDDQIYRALLVLLSDPVARRTAQRACRMMLVDEFQDLTPAHLLLIRLLSAPGGAVFGVGDDDQTIYGYNGADPGWLIDFETLFPGAGDHPLEVNYRCPGGVVEVADRLLRHNQRRVPKTIRAASADPGGWTIADSVDPVAACADAVRGALARGAAPSDIAVLARVNAVLAPVQVALVSEGIPVSGGVGLEFADRTSVRAVLAWLRLATAAERGRFLPDDVNEALRRPSRSFHPRITEWIAEQGSVVDLYALAGRLNNERDADRLTEFAADIQTLQQSVKRGAPTSDIVLQLVDEVGLAGSVSGLDASRRGMNRSAQGDDLTAVKHLAALHDDASTFESWLRSKLAATRSADGVVLATVHRVKGQEWRHVVVHHVDAEQYPHRLADDVEEERRLFHVAITRASEHATIVTGPNPSPFVDELTTEPSLRRIVSSNRPEPAASASRPTASKPASSKDPTADLDSEAAARFERLRVLRATLAEGKPAYVVFDNKTLAAIARTAPTTKQQLARIAGVGPAKLDKFGDAVIELLNEG